MNFYQYLESIGEEKLFNNQVKELNEFIEDIQVYKTIEIGEGEKESLNIYHKEIYLRVETILNIFNQYKGRGEK